MTARVVKFLRDYTGEFTCGYPYKKGAVHSEDEFPYSLRVEGLLAAKVVKVVPVADEKPKATSKKKAAKK